MLEPGTNRELAIKLQYVRQGLEKGQQQLHVSSSAPPTMRFSHQECFTRFGKDIAGYS